MKMRDKKRMRGLAFPAAPPPAGPLSTCPPPMADRFLRPGETKQPPIQSVLATNAQARSVLKEAHERMEQTGQYEWSPTLDKARREAERSRIGRPGGSTFDKGSIAGPKE